MSEPTHRHLARSAALLRVAGYVCLRVSSNDAPFNIIGFGPRDCVLLMASDGWPSKEEIEALRSFPASPHCRKIVQEWSPFQRMPTSYPVE